MNKFTKQTSSHSMHEKITLWTLNLNSKERNLLENSLIFFFVILYQNFHEPHFTASCTQSKIYSVKRHNTWLYTSVCTFTRSYNQTPAPVRPMASPYIYIYIYNQKIYSYTFICRKYTLVTQLTGTKINFWFL